MAAATPAAQAEHQAGRRGGMPVRHAMLVITRAVFDMVEIPGQEPLVVAKDTGDEAARRWWDDRVRAVAADVFERNSDAWERDLANWQAGTDVAVGKERLHEGGPRVDVARIRFPDGTETVVDPQNAHDYVTEEFRARKPQPTVADQFAEWRRPSRSWSCIPGSAGCSTAPSTCPWIWACRCPSSSTRSGRCWAASTGCLWTAGRSCMSPRTGPGAWMAAAPIRTPRWPPNRVSARRVIS